MGGSGAESTDYDRRTGARSVHFMKHGAARTVSVSK